MKIAAIGDLHVSENSSGKFKSLFVEICSKADILLICGDLTNHGLISETRILIDELSVCKIPVLVVLGNHDFQNKKQDEIKQILKEHNFILLDGQPFVIKDVGFAGVKGFAGGFDQYIMPALGEEINIRFVQESINEALRLENALTELRTPKKVVVLHYSPIHQTVEGEPPEIVPFLGSSRLADPIDYFEVNLVFHGHAHHGTPKGKTSKGVPVYNVSYPLLQTIKPDQPYVLVDL